MKWVSPKNQPNIALIKLPARPSLGKIFTQNYFAKNFSRVEFFDRLLRLLHRRQPFRRPSSADDDSQQPPPQPQISHTRRRPSSRPLISETRTFLPPFFLRRRRHPTALATTLPLSLSND